MKYKSIKDFLAIIRNAALKKESNIRISIDDAHKLHNELSMLLLELNENKDANTITNFDGGKFK